MAQQNPRLRAIIVVIWRLSGHYAWLKDKLRQDGTQRRSLPLDAQLNLKLAWRVITKAFDNAPKR